MSGRMVKKVVDGLDWTEPKPESKGKRPDETDEQFFDRFSEMSTEEQLEVMKERCSNMSDDARGAFEAMVEYMEDYYSQLLTFAPAWITEGIAPLYESLGKFIIFLVKAEKG